MGIKTKKKFGLAARTPKVIFKADLY